jgi:hypothetical protein
MTASVSCWWPSAFHIWPEVRIIAGIEASTMTSEGTCRLVMPRSESTMARSGPASYASAMEASTAARWSAGRPSMAVSTAAMPSLGLAPIASSRSPCSTNTFEKKVRTACPNKIGSDTFIMVALRCSENRMPSALAAASCSARKFWRAVLLMKVASTTSPAWMGRASSRTVVVPSPVTCSMRSSSAASKVVDCSLWRKSPVAMVATRVLESGDHAPIEWGWLRANSLTALGARRSEFPSRSTGLTAEPLTRS